MIPFRGEIWKVLSNVSIFRSQYSSDVFRKFVVGCDLKAEKKIQKDIYRTNPGESDMSTLFSSGKNEQLYNVLKAYADYDREIGYC